MQSGALEMTIAGFGTCGSASGCMGDAVLVLGYTRMLLSTQLGIPGQPIPK